VASLKSNIVANYVSQIYVTLIGIVVVPMYIRYMGAEAYGLVGFFAMLQTWFLLLDLGLTPTIARETARLNGGAIDPLSYRRLFRALEGVFIAVALIGGGAMFASAGYIASDWLQVARLPIGSVVTSVQLMAISVALRWIGGLYRGVIGGAEHLVWLGWYNSLLGTLRFVGVLLVLEFVGTTPLIFFGFQAIAALLELTGLTLKVYSILPSIPPGKRAPWSWAPLRPVLTFSLSVAFTSSVWILVTQTDKLVLSKLLPLAEYGYFTLAVLVASGVMIIAGPISGAIMPRMVKLQALGDHASLIRLYRQATQLVAVIGGAASITVAFSAEQLLWVWTGDRHLASQAAPILVLYVIGNGILAVSGFCYLLQYAKGDLRLHVIGNVGFIVLLIPSIVWATSEYGAVGAGRVWLAMNVIYLFFWVPIVHRRFDVRLNRAWFSEDIFGILFVSTISAYVLFSNMPRVEQRWWLAGEIFLFGGFVAIAGAVASSNVRARVTLWIGKKT
jgi:O-antigen/teichoic acid export membrane protein